MKELSSSTSDEVLARILLDLYFYWLLPRQKEDDTSGRNHLNSIRLDKEETDEAVKKEPETDQETNDENESDINAAYNDTVQSILKRDLTVSSKKTDSSKDLHLECDKSRIESQHSDDDHEDGCGFEKDAANQSATLDCSRKSQQKEKDDIVNKCDAASHALNLQVEQGKGRAVDASEFPIGQTSCDAVKRLNHVAGKAKQEANRSEGKEKKRLAKPKRRRGPSASQEATVDPDFGSEDDPSALTQQEIITAENDISTPGESQGSFFSSVPDSPLCRKRGVLREKYQKRKPASKECEKIRVKKQRFAGCLAKEKISRMAAAKNKANGAQKGKESRDPKQTLRKTDDGDKDLGYDMRKESDTNMVSNQFQLVQESVDHNARFDLKSRNSLFIVDFMRLNFIIPSCEQAILFCQFFPGKDGENKFLYMNYQNHYLNS